MSRAPCPQKLPSKPPPTARYPHIFHVLALFLPFLSLSLRSISFEKITARRLNQRHHATASRAAAQRKRHASSGSDNAFKTRRLRASFPFCVTQVDKAWSGVHTQTSIYQSFFVPTGCTWKVAHSLSADTQNMSGA